MSSVSFIASSVSRNTGPTEDIIEIGLAAPLSLSADFSSVKVDIESSINC